MAHSSLQSMAVTGVPKSLKPFIDKGLSMAGTLVKVIVCDGYVLNDDTAVMSERG